MSDWGYGVKLERKHRHYSHCHGVSESLHNIMSTMINEDIITEPVMSKSLYILL